MTFFFNSVTQTNDRFFSVKVTFRQGDNSSKPCFNSAQNYKKKSSLIILLTFDFFLSISTDFFTSFYFLWWWLLESPDLGSRPCLVRGLEGQRSIRRPQFWKAPSVVFFFRYQWTNERLIDSEVSVSRDFESSKTVLRRRTESPWFLLSLFQMIFAREENIESKKKSESERMLLIRDWMRRRFSTLATPSRKKQQLYFISILILSLTNEDDT